MERNQMDKDQDIAFKAVVFAQAFVDCIAELEGSSFYKHQVKNRGKSFIQEVDKLLDSAYSSEEFGMGLVAIIEECHDAIEDVLDTKVLGKQDGSDTQDDKES
jgi:hypothetical protein|tara:strand:+ start:588 stop:896 length:309 start_codon:yes stop_codon:yes gene_type:complete